MLHDARQRVVGLTASNNSGLTWDSLSWGLELDGCILVMFLCNRKAAKLLCYFAVKSLLFQFYEVLSEFLHTVSVALF